jgi:hypothetical protein
MAPYDNTYDFAAAIDRHYEFRAQVIPELLALGKKAFRLQSELDTARAELEQALRWVEYYMTEAERIKRDYGFYRQP